MRIRSRSLVALLALLALVLTALPPLGASAASASPMTDSEAIALLRTYNIVRGQPGGQLDLDSRLTRAQAAALFVRVLGVDQLAPSVAELVPFTDAVGHWAAGEITLAQRMGLMKGDGNGTFRPDAEITYAEVLTVLLRIVQQEPQGAWSPQKMYDAAGELGFAPAGVSPTTPAIRGKIFWSLAVSISQVQLPSGDTALHKYLDQTAPVLTLDAAPATTLERSITVSGVTQGASSVRVAGQAAQLDQATGRFSATVNLDLGNNTVQVEATDPAGNKASAHIVIERITQVATLDITNPPSVVKVGSSVRLEVVAKDSKGQTAPLTGLQATMSNDIAAFDIDHLTLTAGNRIGSGTLTLQLGTIRKTLNFSVTDVSARAVGLSFTPVNNGIAPTVGKEASVPVLVIDSSGRMVNDDYWRPITLTSSNPDIRIAQATVNSQGGVAVFKITGRAEGAGTLTASSGDLADVTADVQIATATRVVLTSSPTSLRPDGASTTRIQASLQDDTGKAVTNTSGSEIRINLNATGTDGYFVDSVLSIPAGANSSGTDSATYHAGILAGNVKITGTIASAQRYTIQGLAVPVQGTRVPAKLQIIGPTTAQAPNGTAAQVVVQVLDAQNQLVTTGSYGFKVKISTSNEEPVTNGLPQGVSLTYPGLDNGPVQVDNGTAVGRTYQGKATLNLTYDKSGTVTLMPVPVDYAEEAFNPNIGSGPASATTGLSTASAIVTFAGTPAAIQLTADSALGQDKPGGAVRANGTMTVHARVVDRSGAVIPTYSGTITLTRQASGNKVTRLSGTSTDTVRQTAVRGEAQFTVLASAGPGYDVYTASATSLPTSDITVAVRKDKPSTPTIVAIRGVTEGDMSPVAGYVGPDADYMDIQLMGMVPPNDGEATYWVTAKVFKKGASTPLASGLVVDLMSPLPTVRVPKASLAAGKATYEVLINDGSLDSDRSPDLGLSDAVNAVLNSSYKITAAYYDAATTKLTLITSGLSNTGSISPDRLTIVKGTNRLSLDSTELKILSITSASAILQLNGLAASLDPDTYNGTVVVEALASWYQNTDGSLVAPKYESVPLKPMATITGATFDKANRRITLLGVAFSQGALALDQIQIGGVALKPGTATTNDKLVSGMTSDTSVTISLGQPSFDAISALNGPVIPLTAGTGWLKTTYNSVTYQAMPLTGDSRQLYVNVTVSMAQYDSARNTLTLTGKGFTGATLDPTKLKFRIASSRNATPYRFTADTTATTVDDDTITITLSAADASYYESTTNGFGGKQVVMNTEDNWLQDAQHRPAAPLPTDRILFSVSVR